MLVGDRHFRVMSATKWRKKIEIYQLETSEKITNRIVNTDELNQIEEKLLLMMEIATTGTRNKHLERNCCST